MTQPQEKTSDRLSGNSRRRFIRNASRGLVGATVVAGTSSSTARAADGTVSREGVENGIQAQGPITSVREFGAAGDGETDDTAAVRNAVDAAPGGIFFPKGRYRLTEPVGIDLDRVGPVSIIGDGTATVVMAGEGPAFHLVGTHDGTANPSNVEQAVWRRQRMPQIDGLEIVGAHEQAVGLRLERTMQAIISRLAVRGARHGIHLVGRNRNVLIGECQIYENQSVGIYLDEVNLHQINISNSHISYNRGGGIVVRGSEVRNLQIGTCDLEANMSEDGPATANVLVDAREGSMREGAITGCTIQHSSSSAPGSANIRFVGRQPPIKAGRFSIADSAIADAPFNIHLENSRGVTITGNTFWMGADYHLLAENSSHVIFSANLLEHNPDYGDLESSANGIEFRNCAFCTLSDLHVEQDVDRQAYLTIRNSDSMNISDSFIVGYRRAGILMDEVERSRVSTCTIRPSEAAGADQIAIDVQGGQDNMIVNNILAGPVEASSDTAVVRDNQVS